MKSCLQLLIESIEEDKALITKIANTYVEHYGSKSGVKLFGMPISKVLSDKTLALGKCYEITQDFVRWARANEPFFKYNVITGEMDDSTEDKPSFHFAVKIGSLVLDLTSKQFSESNPIVNIYSVNEFKKKFKNTKTIR